VAKITIPLKERQVDILPLLFFHEQLQRNSARIFGESTTARQMLLDCLAGNVRELRNILNG
jgi:transcriptional regulator with AAA-type ATPase domain